MRHDHYVCACWEFHHEFKACHWPELRMMSAVHAHATKRWFQEAFEKGEKFKGSIRPNSCLLNIRNGFDLRVDQSPRRQDPQREPSSSIVAFCYNHCSSWTKFQCISASERTSLATPMHCGGIARCRALLMSISGYADSPQSWPVAIAFASEYV